MPEDPVWWFDRHVNQTQQHAVQEVFLSYLVGILAHGGATPGSGTLVTWRERLFILTASHVIADTNPNEINYHTRIAGAIIDTTAEDSARRPDRVPRSGEKLDVLGVVAESKEGKDDIAIIELRSRSNIGRSADFYKLVDTQVNIHDGASVLSIGYATDSSAPIAPGRRGIVATASNSVFDSSLNATPGLPSSYDENRQFLLKYARTDDGIEPPGFSGTGAWCNITPPGPVWTAHPLLVGVITSWHRKKNLLQLTRLEPILELFRGIR
jgi:hypothetical protein